MMKLLLSGAMVIAVMCAGGGGEYSIGVTNSTGGVVRDAAVVYGEFRSVTGSMNPGVTKTHRFVSAPLPDRVTVEWRTPDQVLHSKQVEVRPLVPARFTGTVYFEIGPGEEVHIRTERP